MPGDETADAEQPDSSSAQSPTASAPESTCATTKMTCDALCSLSYSPSPDISNHPGLEFDMSQDKPGKKGGMGCPKQHQLPMFLSSKLIVQLLSSIPHFVRVAACCCISRGRLL
jgi:hypothetical protein